jgi:hypothetical protein
MKTFVLTFAAALMAALVTSCASTQPPITHALYEPWVFQFDSRHWQLGSQSGDGSRNIREYVLSGQTVDNWSELVTSGYWAVLVSPRSHFEYFRRLMLHDCPAARISVIEESADTILFEWQHDGCGSYPAQHELRRISRCRTGMFVLSFVEKTPQLSAEKRATWISIIKSAHVRPDA